VDETPLLAWGVTLGVILALLALDFIVAVRRPHAVGIREATLWSVFYIGVAIAFGLSLWALTGPDKGTEFFAGWVVEKSLSVDNLFLFVIIVTRFAVPAEYRQKALLFASSLRSSCGPSSSPSVPPRSSCPRRLSCSSACY
jgi:tellurite resistance protein TerC